MVAGLSETDAPTSRWCVADQGVIIPNLSDTLQPLWSNSSVFTSEKSSKNLNFNSFLPLTKTLEATFNETSFRGYFQWEACANFQKKCSWARYNFVEFFTATSIFLVALLRFRFRKVAWKSKFSELFYLLKRFWWLL